MNGSGRAGCRIARLGCLLLSVAAATAGISTTASEASASRPNILFVFTDDHATQALSAYGGRLTEMAPTPNLDQLAKDGIRFTRCMVGNSICGPSRATILTGKHSHLNGFLVNEKTQFNGSQQTFPKLLRQTGYQTAIIGKWHLGSEPTGFDHWEVLPGQGNYYNPEFLTPEGRIQVAGYVTDVITDKAKEWLANQRNKNKPFMLMVQHKAPHREWLPALKYLHLFDDVKIPEPDTLFDDYARRGTAAREQDMSIEKTMEVGRDLKVREMDDTRVFFSRSESRMTAEQFEAWNAAYQPKNELFLKAGLKGKDLVRWKYQRYAKDYLRCIRSVDDSIGELREFLKKHELAENTVIVYSSDQGFYVGEHGWFDKRFMYDESFRTPLLAYWPGVTPAGTVNSDLVSNLDFAETFLDIAGVEIPEDMQGVSLTPLLKGGRPENWRDSVYYHYYEYPGWHMVQRHEGVYDGRYKLMNFYDVEEWEFYDLKTDPKEMTNQYSNPDYAETVKRVHRKLEELRKQYDVPENVRQDLTDVDMSFHSEVMRKRAIGRERRKTEKAREKAEASAGK